MTKNKTEFIGREIDEELNKEFYGKRRGKIKSSFLIITKNQSNYLVLE